jgi:hypothetical protein
MPYYGPTPNGCLACLGNPVLMQKPLAYILLMILSLSGLTINGLPPVRCKFPLIYTNLFFLGMDSSYAKKCAGLTLMSVMTVFSCESVASNWLYKNCLIELFLEEKELESTNTKKITYL